MNKYYILFIISLTKIQIKIYNKKKEYEKNSFQKIINYKNIIKFAFFILLSKYISDLRDEWLIQNFVRHAEEDLFISITKNFS